MSNSVKLEKKVGDLLKGGDVAWNLQKRANKARNSNKRFYGFFKFAGVLIFEDAMKNAFDVAKKVGERYVPSAFDENKEIEKLDSYLKLHDSLGKSGSEISEEVKRAKAMLKEKIKTSVNKLDGTEKSIDTDSRANAQWSKSKDHINTTEDIIFWVYNIAKRVFDYAEERNELLVKSLENEAADPVTTEHFQMIKEILRGSPGAVNWDNVFAEASDTKVKSDLVDRQKNYSKANKNLIINDIKDNWSSLVDRIEKEAMNAELQLMKDPELSLAEKKRRIDKIIKDFLEKIAEMKKKQEVLNKQIAELKLQITNPENKEKKENLEKEKKRLEDKAKKKGNEITNEENEKKKVEEIKVNLETGKTA